MTKSSYLTWISSPHFLILIIITTTIIVIYCFVMRTINSFSNFQIYNIMFLTVITMMYNRFLELNSSICLSGFLCHLLNIILILWPPPQPLILCLYMYVVHSPHICDIMLHVSLCLDQITWHIMLQVHTFHKIMLYSINVYKFHVSIKSN
jgi:hypothetical protein